MKRYPAHNLRNCALVSHSGAGKTSLAEAMLFDAGAIDRLGRTDEGTSTLDHEAEEVRRKLSISTALAPVEWAEHKLNLLDAPGYFDFVGEVLASLRVVESAIIVVDGVAGVEVGTELVWRYADDRNLPRLVVVNKLDRENASFERAVTSLKQTFNVVFLPVALPLGEEDAFRGVIDVLGDQQLVQAGRDAAGKNYREEPIPESEKDQTLKAREALTEAAAEADDDLLTRYLDGEALTAEEVRSGLRVATLKRRIVPVVPASALRNIGVQFLARTIIDLLPSPVDQGHVAGEDPRNGQVTARKPSEDEHLSALVFKTMADPYVGRLTLFRVYSGVLRSDSTAYNPRRDRNERIAQLFVSKGKYQESVPAIGPGDLGAVAKLQETVTGDTLTEEAHPVVYPPLDFPEPVFAVAIVPKSKGDEEKISSGLSRLVEEDPTFRVRKDSGTGQLLIVGMGDMHLDIVTDRLKRKFGVEVSLHEPRVPYRETIRTAVKVEGKHKKQTGGRGQFGHVWIELEPTGPEVEFEFTEKVFGGSVPRQYIPAVEKGIREALVEGVLAGYPIVNLRAILYDGSYHTVDSSEMAFKIAASMALKKGVLQAQPILLEPIMKVDVMVPEQFMGDIMGDLNRRRGRILGMEQMGTTQVIRAHAPMAELFDYAIDLRSITQGRGTYRMEPSHYEEVPAAIAQQVIEAAKKVKEA
ncbi:MAG TPA: elongation factor G [Bacillota bacterium]|nr:elongation factor G [Bacillota bacterium]